MQYIPKEDVIQKNVDWVVIGLYLVMVLYGWLSIYGASYDYSGGEDSSLFDLSGRAGMQLLWIGVSILVGFAILKLDSYFLEQFAYVFYAGFMLLLLLTIFIAPNIKGSHSWLVLGPIRLQPAELAKFTVALALARFMSEPYFRLMQMRNLFFVLVLIILPMFLIIMQKEAGSALVYTAFILVLYREGLPGIVLYLGVCAITLFVVGLKYSAIEVGMMTLGELLCLVLILFIVSGLIMVYARKVRVGLYMMAGISVVFALAYLLDVYGGVGVPYDVLGIGCFVVTLGYLLYIGFVYIKKMYFGFVLVAISALLFSISVSMVFTDVLQPHQQQRIKVSLGMENDLMGVGYNVNQSKIAIGSGGFWGKGFLNGTQTKLKYVPEQDTDFIFCTVGEEQGFVGSVAVLGLFLGLILRLIYLSERQKFAFGRVFGYSIVSIFIFHLVINIGMVIGITPVIGIPLPFFSYGGSSLLGFTILLFIFLRIDMTRKRR